MTHGSVWYQSRLRPMSHLQFIARFCRATLSRDKIASVTWRVAQLLNSLATPFRLELEQRSILCNFVVKMRIIELLSNQRSPHLCTTKLQCATRHVTLAILSRDKDARQNRRCDIGLSVRTTAMICLLRSRRWLLNWTAAVDRRRTWDVE